MKSRLSGAGANLSANSKALGMTGAVVNGPITFLGATTFGDAVVNDTALYLKKFGGDGTVGGYSGSLFFGPVTLNMSGGVNSLWIGNVVEGAHYGQSDNCTLIGTGTPSASAGGGSMNGYTAIGAGFSQGGATQNTVQIGYASVGSSMRSVVIGASATGGYGSVNTVLIGQATSQAYATPYCIILGAGAVNTASNQFVAGSSASPINAVYFGKGVTNASPTAYTINGTGGSGSNIAGADVNLAGGVHTGTPTTQTTGSVRVQTSLVGAAASTMNSLVDRVIVKAGRLTLTNSSANNVVDVALPTLTGTAGMIRYEVYATDGTDVQVRRGSMQYSAVNKSGTYTSETAVTAEAASCSAGTLTATWGIANGTNKITVQVTPTSSLTTTTLYLCYQIENNSEQAVTIL